MALLKIKQNDSWLPVSTIDIDAMTVSNYEYSEDEKIVGCWTDGKPLYRSCRLLSSVNPSSKISLNISDIDVKKTNVLNKYPYASLTWEIKKTSNGNDNAKQIFDVYYDDEYIKYSNCVITILQDLGDVTMHVTYGHNVTTSNISSLSVYYNNVETFTKSLAAKETVTIDYSMTLSAGDTIYFYKNGTSGTGSPIDVVIDEAYKNKYTNQEYDVFFNNDNELYFENIGTNTYDNSFVILEYTKPIDEENSFDVSMLSSDTLDTEASDEDVEEVLG